MVFSVIDYPLMYNYMRFTCASREMNMPRLAGTRLTDTYVKRIKPRDKVFEIRDAGQQGLVLRVHPSGTKKFVAQLNRSTRSTLGDASLIKVKTAQQWVRKILTDFEDGKDVGRKKSPALSLKDYLEGEFTDWQKTHSKHGERDTRRLVATLGRLGSSKLGKLTHRKIDRWKIDRASIVKPATLNRELASLKSALNRAVEWSLLDENPAKHVKAIKDDAGKRARYLDKKERKRLHKALKACESPYLPVMVNLILHTGLRRGEVFSLCWEDIDLDAPILHVRAANAKSSKDRYIPLNKNAVTLLKGWRLRSGNREGLVFRNPAGYQLRDIKRQWIKLMKAAEISDFRFHDLRHDFASRLVQASVDLYRVKDLLGHSTITLTERYSHLQPRHLLDAVQKLESSKG